MNRDRFIVFEGPDGVGKSTILNEVAGRLRARGDDVLTTREPGGSPAAEAMRTTLLTPEVGDASALSQLLLITAARVAHWEQTIAPALRCQRWVLCDRHLDSSVVYQCRLGGVPVATLEQINHAAGVRLAPLRIFLEVDERTAWSRLQNRAEGNRFDPTHGQQWQRLADAYRWCRTQYPQGAVVVDAAAEVDIVAARCHQVIEEWQ